MSDDDKTEVLLHDEVESPLALHRKAQVEDQQPKSIGPIRNDEGVWVGTCPWCGAKVRLMSDKHPNQFWPQWLIPRDIGVWCDAVIDKLTGKRCEGQALVAGANQKTMRVRLIKAVLRAGGGFGEGRRIWMPN